MIVVHNLGSRVDEWVQHEKRMCRVLAVTVVVVGAIIFSAETTHDAALNQKNSWRFCLFFLFVEQ